MNDTEQKLEVLASVARRFNEENITWAVGASLLLYLKGKTEIFHDIDIMLMEADADKAKAILSELGVVEEPAPRAQYKTRHFCILCQLLKSSSLLQKDPACPYAPPWSFGHFAESILV